MAEKARGGARQELPQSERAGVAAVSGGECFQEARRGRGLVAVGAGGADEAWEGVLAGVGLLILRNRMSWVRATSAWGKMIALTGVSPR